MTPTSFLTSVYDSAKTYELHGPGTEPRPPVIERRQAERFSPGRKRFVRVLACSDLRSCEATIKDFSMSGLGIITDEPLEPGTIIALQLRSSQSGLSGMLSGQVCRSVREADGRWTVGCSLSRRLSYREAVVLL